ncbi:MAG: DNA polymerase III PolC-type [Elusimicrobia bacterium]|nr:DNA polymerase III PolC-type [Elusimicrobiota bacterium]
MPTPILEADYCVVDTETTGGKAEENRIIDIAVYHVRDGIVLGQFRTLLNPGCPIPSWITALTGIDDAMVRGAPRFLDVAPDLKRFLEKGVFVAHNVPFDYRFIQCEFDRLNEHWERPALCTLKLARKLYPELPSRSLGNLCEHLMIDITDRHRASGDAEATRYLLKHLLKEVRRRHGITTFKELNLFFKSRRDRHTKPGLSSSSATL